MTMPDLDALIERVRVATYWRAYAWSLTVIDVVLLTAALVGPSGPDAEVILLACMVAWVPCTILTALKAQEPK